MARVSQEEIDKRIAAYGGPAMVHSPTADTKKVPNPAHKDNGGTSYTVPETIDVTVQRWKGADLAEIEAYQLPDGSWEVTKETPAPAKPATTAATAQAQPPETKDEGGTRYQWKPNPGGPTAGGQWVAVGSAPMTPAERQAADAAAPTQTTRTEVVNGQTYTIVTIIPKPGQPGQPGQIVLGPDGKPAAGGVPGKRPEEKKTTVKGPDGKTYIQVTVQHPDGRAEIYHTDQSGVRATLPNDPNVPSGAPPPAAGPRPSFTVGDAAIDLDALDVRLNEQVREWYASNGARGISPATADKERENRRALWEIAIKETQGIVNTQQAEAGRQTTERGQTLQDLGNRRSSATSLSNAATTAAMDTVGNAGAGAPGGDFLALLRYVRNSAQDFVTGTGANREVPVTQPGPMLTSVNSQGPLGQRGTSLLNPRAPFVQPPAAVTPPPPSGAEVEAARQTTMAANRAATAPLLAPPPPVAGPNPATPNLVPPPPVPVAVPPPVNQSPVFIPRPMTTVLPVPGSGVDPNMAPGVLPGMPGAPATIPGFVPNQMPVDVPYPTGPGAQSVMSPQAPGFLSAMRPGSQAYDPTPSAMSMIQDPSWDNEAVKEAYRQLYGRELQIA